MTEHALPVNGNMPSAEAIKDFLWPIVAIGGLGAYIDFLIGRTGQERAKDFRTFGSDGPLAARTGAGQAQRDKLLVLKMSGGAPSRGPPCQPGSNPRAHIRAAIENPRAQ
jgi:hypothetical protein